MARSNTIWEKVKAQVKERAVAVSFTGLTMLLQDAGKYVVQNGMEMFKSWQG